MPFIDRGGPPGCGSIIPDGSIDGCGGIILYMCGGGRLPP